MQAYLFKAAIWILLPLACALGQTKASATVTGTVRDRSSAPVERLSVTLRSIDRAFQVKSPQDGHFYFENVPDGVYQLEISSPGFVKQKLPVTVSHGTPQALEIVLQVGNMPDMDYCGPHPSVTYQPIGESGPRLSGVIRDYVGDSSINKAEILLRAAGEKQILSKCKSDRNGKFEFPDIAAGYYDLRILKQGYRPAEERKLLLPRENSTVLDVQLLKSSQVVACQ